jgi:hypothetical protein
MIETVEVDGTEYTLGADKDSTVAFTEAGTRANIASDESLATMFGKIKKFFTDLKTVAFTGSYDDLSDKPQVELTYAEYQTLVDNNEDDPDVEYFCNDIETASTDYIETSVVTALTGATSLTITNSYITPTCRPRVFAQPASCKTTGSTQYKVKAKISSITNGSCTLSFPALAENTEFKLLINAPEVSSPIITRQLKGTTQSATINAGAEYSATFDFTSQLDDDETIIGIFPDATGVAGLTIRIFYPNSTGKTATVVWRNTTSSSLTAPSLRVTVIAMKISL